MKFEKDCIHAHKQNDDSLWHFFKFPDTGLDNVMFPHERILLVVFVGTIEYQYALPTVRTLLLLCMNFYNIFFLTFVIIVAFETT